MGSDVSLGFTLPLGHQLATWQRRITYSPRALSSPFVPLTKPLCQKWLSTQCAPNTVQGIQGMGGAGGVKQQTAFSLRRIHSSERKGRQRINVHRIHR